jgi:hypothetical protein
MKHSTTKTWLISILALPIIIATHAYADNLKKQIEPVELLIDFKIAGKLDGYTIQGIPYYTIGGPGYAPKKIFNNGEISDSIKAERQVTTLQGAKITFSGAPSDPIIRFTCLPGTCNMAFKDGSVLTSDAGVALEGRAINFWGPVVNSPDYDPQNGIVPIRIMGCGGLKEIAGKGRLAGMVGSICFNGVLNFNLYDQTVLSGSSKCTITMHTPANPAYVPKTVKKDREIVL